MKYERQYIHDNGVYKRVYICPNCGGYKLDRYIGTLSSYGVVYTCEDCGRSYEIPRWENIAPSFETLREVLKKVGLFASDINIRVKNKQISLNGVIADGKEKLDILFEDEKSIQDCGDFVFYLCKKNPLWGLKLRYIGLESYFDDSVEINDSLSEYLKGYRLLKVSKKQQYIIKLWK